MLTATAPVGPVCSKSGFSVFTVCLGLKFSHKVSQPLGIKVGDYLFVLNSVNNEINIGRVLPDTDSFFLTGTKQKKSCARSSNGIFVPSAV